MGASESEELVYRFSAFGARGTITLKERSVHTTTWTVNGWWEQTIPLEALSANHGTLITRPPLYTTAWIIAISVVLVGACRIITAAMLFHVFAGVLLLLGGFLMGYRLYPYRKAEWIMFPTSGGWQGLNYTRQGPDADLCDAFTERVKQAIRSGGAVPEEGSTSHV